MDHVKVLNEMLAHDCARRKFGRMAEFVIDLHCVTVRIIARLTSVDPDITYDILRVDITD